MIIFQTGCYPGDDFGINVSMQIDEVETGLCSANVINSYLIHDGNPSVSEVGICWEEMALDIIPTVDRNSKKAGNISTPYSIFIENMKESTNYIVRPYMKVDGYYVYGDCQMFKIPSNSLFLPKLGNLSLVKAELDKLTVSSSIADVPVEYPVTEVGVCYTTQSLSNFTSESIGVTTIKATLNDGKFVTEVLDLTYSTTYKFRAYAKNKAGIIYGEIESFRTSGDEYVPQLGEISITKNAPTYLEISCKVTEPLATDSVKAWLEYFMTYGSTQSVDAKIVNGIMTAKIENLQPSYSYSIIAKAENKFGVGSSSKKQVTTSSGEKSKPTVGVPIITDITADGAHVESNIKIVDSDYKALSGGFQYSTSYYMTSPISKEGVLENDTLLKLDLSGLSENKTYYIRAYIETELGKIYSSNINFSTAERIPLISELNVKSILKTSVDLSAMIKPYDENSPITEAGVQYTTYSSISSGDKKNAGTITGDSVFVDLFNLKKGTKYIMRAYAVSNNKSYYGPVMDITTKTDADYAPSITETVVLDTTMTSMTLKSTYAFENDVYKVKEAGFQYYKSTNPSYVANGSLYPGIIEDGNISLSISNLIANTTYQVRPYVKLDDETIYYGETISVNTKKESDYFGEIIVTDIKMTSFKLSSAHKFSSKSYKIKEAGFQYYKSNNSSYVANGSLYSGIITDGIITLSVSELVSNSKYQIRAYVKLDDETIYYSNTISVTTKQASDYTPTFTDVLTTDITMTSMTLNSTYTLINEDYKVKEVGFQYYESNYSSQINNGKLHSSSINGNDIVLEISGLSANTTYQIRPYVKLDNEETYYGKTVAVKTKDVENYIGDVIVSDILISSAKLKASIGKLPSNYKITEAGFYYCELNGNYIWKEKTVAVEIIDGFIQMDISSLKSSCNHKARAYVKYIYEKSSTSYSSTSYGNYTNFTTLSTSVLPSVICNDITSVNTSSFSIEADVKENHEYYPITEAGFVYIKSTSSSALTLNTNNAIRKPLTVENGKIKLTVDGLDGNSTYLVRAYIISGEEVAYNEQTIKVYTNMDNYKPTMGTLSIQKKDDKYVAVCTATSSQVFPITECGFVYSTQTMSPSIEQNEGNVTAQITDSEFTGVIPFERPQTGSSKYYVRGYAKNANGIKYTSYKSVNVLWND